MKKGNSLMVIPPKQGKIRVSLLFSLVYISLVASVTIANTDRIQDGAWLKLSCI